MMYMQSLNMQYEEIRGKLIRGRRNLFEVVSVPSSRLCWPEACIFLFILFVNKKLVAD